MSIEERRGSVKAKKKKKRVAPNKLYWSPEELEFLTASVNSMSNEQLAKKLNRSQTALRHKLYSMGLRRYKQYAWTKAHTDYVLKNYSQYGNIELAERMNKKFPRKNHPWTKKMIQAKLKRMKVFRTPTEIERIIERNRINGRYTVAKANATRRAINASLDDDYIVTYCLRISPISRERVKQDCQGLIKLTRERILARRAKRQAESYITDTDQLKIC